MKVLTLHQPWASLIALGVKTIETRGWSTTYRGPLAIHASALRHRRMTCSLGQWRYGGLSQCLWREDEQHRVRDYQHVPVGAIVATCTLVDVVPIIDGACGPGHAVLQVHYDCLLGDDPFYDPRIHRNFTNQRPYGDFTAGRYAWLLADVVPVDPPVPFKGGQGLTKTWTPEAVSA